MEQSWTFVRGVANTALDGLEAGGLPSTLLRWERRVPAHTAGREWGVGSYWLLGPQETPARWVQGLVTQLPQILLDAPCPEVDLTSDSRRILLRLTKPRPSGPPPSASPWCLPPGLLPCPLPRSRCLFLRAELPPRQPVGSTAPPGVPVTAPHPGTLHRLGCCVWPPRWSTAWPWLLV